MVYKDTFIVYKFIVDPSIDSLTVQLHELMLLWNVRSAFFAALRTLSLGLNSKQAWSWFCFAHIKQQISYSPPEATLKLELHRVQNARSFPNELQVRNLTVTSGVIFFTRPGIYNCISFSLMSKKEYQVPNSTFSLLIETSL